MNLLKVFKFILFLIIFTESLSSQESHTNSFILESQLHYGFIIKHSGKLEGLTKTNPFGFELTAQWQFMSEKSWNYCFCYPKAGLSFMYINFANKDVLGSSYSLYPYIEPHLGSERLLHPSFRFGIGPVFLDKVFDSITNPENKFYSSPISFVVHLSFGLNINLNKKYSFKLSAGMNHISNGGIKNPNLGINFPTVSLGFNYNFYPLPFEQRLKDKSKSLIDYKHRIDFVLFGTGKTAVKGQERYPVFGISSTYSKVFRRMNAVSAGCEFTIDYADKEEIRKNNIFENVPTVDHKYFAILLGHDLILGRFNFYQQLGIYLYSPFKRMDPVYQRYGLSFYLTEKIFFGINLKVHLHTADFLDMRIGYSI